MTVAPRTETAGPEPATSPQVRRLIVIMEAVTDMTPEDWTLYLRHVLAYDEITELMVVGAVFP